MGHGRQYDLLALQRALTLRGVSNYLGELIHHSDRGGQYVSDDYTNTLHHHGIKISMCIEVLENAHIERANGTIKNDYLKRWQIASERQLFERMEMAVNNYNNRKHHSLGMTPIEFENYIKELHNDQRAILDIFVYKQNVDNPMQLKLFLDEK